MAIKFTDLQGKASKSGPERYKPVNGKNVFRIVGSVIPSYKYWLKTRDGTTVPLECLSFDPQEEKFDNRKPDPVRKYFPEQKCSWAYQSFVIDKNEKDGPPKVKLFDHKKKLFESILDAAKKKMGDPTDPEKGWDVVFTRTKTGPKAFNVEYNLEFFELENSPLTEEEKAAVEEAGRIEDAIFRQSVEDQEKFIKDFILPEENVDEEAAEELQNNRMEDDIPFDAD